MESVVKQGIDFLKREGRRVQNLLKGKVIIQIRNLISILRIYFRLPMKKKKNYNFVPIFFFHLNH